MNDPFLSRLIYSSRLFSPLLFRFSVSGLLRLSLFIKKMLPKKKPPSIPGWYIPIHRGRIAIRSHRYPIYLLQLTENVRWIHLLLDCLPHPKISPISFVGVCGSLARSEKTKFCSALTIWWYYCSSYIGF